MTVSAPAKLMLIGEYAVLEGGVAIACAVNRRATGESIPALQNLSPVVRAVVARATRGGFRFEEGLSINTDSFYDGDLKLGIGSSAAVAVVSSAIITGLGDERALEVAVDGHREAAGGEGSGVDVAVSFYGGVIAARSQPSAVEPLASSIGDLRLSVLHTGESASTPDMIRACRSAVTWDRWTGIMRDVALRAVEAYRTQNAPAFCQQVAEYGRAMAGLGRDAGVPVVTEKIEEIMHLAQSRGAVAKPSGAGGGDIVVLWSREVADAAKIAEESGCRLLDLAVEPKGLARR